MAGTSDDSSTPDNNWLLLYAALIFVARQCTAFPEGDRLIEAARLIVEYANKGHFLRWKFDGAYIDPRHWGACHLEYGLYIPVDFYRNTVKYIRLPADQAEKYTTTLAQNDLLEPYQGPPYSEMSDVHIHRDDVVSMLRELGLLSLPMPAEPVAALAQLQAVPSVAASEEVTAPAAEQCEPQGGQNKPGAEPHGWQADRVKRVLCKLYPPEGKTPSTKSYKTLQAEIDCGPDIQAENKRERKTSPSEDVVAAVVKWLGRSDR